MKNKEDENWKEFWRNNSPTYKANKKAEFINRLLIITSIIGIAIFIFILPKEKFKDMNINGIISQNDDAISYFDHVYISYMDELRILLEDEKLNIDELNKLIKSINKLNVSSVFNELHTNSCNKLNELSSLNKHDKNFKNEFFTYMNVFYNNLENTLLENKKFFYKEDDMINYKYKALY